MTTIGNATDISTLQDADQFAVERPSNTTAYKATVAEIRSQVLGTIPAAGDDGTWNHVFTEVTFDAQPDQLMFIGYNVDGHSGSAPDESLQSIYIGFESDYYVGGNHYGEFYVEWYSIDRQSNGRPFSYSVDLDSGDVIAQHWGQQIFYDSDGTLVMTFSDGGPVEMQGASAYFRVHVNNASMIRQINTGGNAYVPLIMLNSNNRVFLGDTGYDCQANGDFYFGIDSVGPVLVDRTSGANYRLYVDGGALAIEAVV